MIQLISIVYLATKNKEGLAWVGGEGKGDKGAQNSQS